MGNILGNIISFLLSPPGLIIVFGLIGGLGRLGAWFQSERAKRMAVQNQARREAEDLRTGRPVAMGSLREPSQTQGAQSRADTDEQQQAERQRALQAQRTAQLRALQQKRLAELRARRGAQQGTTPTPTPGQTPAPASSQPARPVRTAERPASGRGGRSSDAARTTPPRGSRPARSQPEPQPVTSPFDRPARPMPSAAAAPATKPVDVTEIGGPVNPAVGRQPAPVAAPVGIGPLVALRNDLRRAVMIAEVLGPPVSERDPDRPGVF